MMFNDNDNDDPTGTKHLLHILPTFLRVADRR